KLICPECRACGAVKTALRSAYAVVNSTKRAAAGNALRHDESRLQSVPAGRRTIESFGKGCGIHGAVSTEPFDQALDRFRVIEKQALLVLVLMATLLGYLAQRYVPHSGEPHHPHGGGNWVENPSRRLDVPRPRDDLRRPTDLECHARPHQGFLQSRHRLRHLRALSV